jgi:Prion-inhibition and propagation
MEPGTYISIASIAFQGAVFAVKAFRKGLNYSKDAERLVLGLEVERFRLHLWGENVGLSRQNGLPATLPARMIPICETLKHYLEQIEQLVKNVEGLSSQYGLLETDEPPTKSELVRRLVQRMQRSITSASSPGGR